MLVRRIVEKVRAENWLTLFLELGLVVIGILLAFQLDRAYQAYQDRQLEQRYLQRLHADLQGDVDEIDVNIRRTQTRLEQVELLRTVLRNPEAAAADPEAFAHALEQVTWRSVPNITTGTYEELESTGRTVLLRSEKLRSGLADYYGLIAGQQRLGLGEDDQDRFRVATLGLLSSADLSAIEDPERYPFDMSPERARQVAIGFAARTAAHPWLSRLTKYQVLMRRLAEEFRERATGLLEQIDAQLARSD